MIEEALGRVNIARCPEHGLHGCRTNCFECGEEAEQVEMISTSELAFSAQEQEIVNLINEAHQKILDLDLRCNKSELASHVHGMQMFVLKHSLQRLGFKGLSRWFWRDL